jgi:hypothetical protein
MFVVRLLEPPTMANNRILLTKRASAYDGLVRVFGPASSNLLQRDRYLDKEDRYLSRVPLLASNPPRYRAGSGPRLLKKLHLKENIGSYSNTLNRGNS